MTQVGGGALSPSLLKSIARLVRMMHPSMKAVTTTVNQDQPGKQRMVAQALAELEELESNAHNNISQVRKRGRSRSRSRDPKARKKRSPRSSSSDRGRPRHKPSDGDGKGLSVAHSQQNNRQCGGRDKPQLQEDERRPPQQLDEAPVLSKLYDWIRGRCQGFRRICEHPRC